jgi:hypothetical protein
MHNIIIVSTTKTEYLPTPTIIKLHSLLFFIIRFSKYTLIFFSFE